MVLRQQAAELLQQGVALRQQGDLEGALRLYRQAVALPDAPAEAHFNLGNVLFQQQWQSARQAFAQSLQLQPELAGAWIQQARCAMQLQQLEVVREDYLAALRCNPDDFSSWLELGHVQRQLGLSDAMLQAYQRACEVAPHRWESLVALMRALEEQGQFDAAAVAYHRAVLALGRLHKEHKLATEQGGSSSLLKRPATLWQLHGKVAQFRLERGDAARALKSLRQALMAARQDASLDENAQAELFMDLGEALLRLSMHDEAHRAFERASMATSEAALTRLANLSFRNNLWAEALAVLERSVELHPQSALALWNLAYLQAECWQLDAALVSLAKAEAIEPQSGARSLRASVAGRMGDAETALRLYRELAAEQGPLSKMASSAAMSSLYSDQLSAHEVAKLHRDLFAPLASSSRSASSFANSRQLGRRLRLGLVTADFHQQHPVNIFMQPILKRLDRAQFEITVYFTGVSYDEQTQLARSRVRQWVECTTWNDGQLARRIEDDGIDILLDLAGHTSLQRMSMFAQRAAPVQATFLGYPGSTGVPNIDWLIADQVVAPAAHQDLYSERLIHLPHTVFCYSPEINYPFPDYKQIDAERPLTFGSFNNVPKLTPHTLRLWAAILHEVPGSRLLLKAPSFKDESAIKVFTERLLAEGVDPARLEFRGPVGLADMMAEYADVDIALDPVPYNGGTTTLQAMWMGVPVVVKAGNNFVSRMGASFMSAANLADWVADSDEDYVRIAKQMASDRQALLSLKQGLRQRLLNSPAWDIEQYAKDFGDCLNRMWAEFVEG